MTDINVWLLLRTADHLGYRYFLRSLKQKRLFVVMYIINCLMDTAINNKNNNGGKYNK